MSTATITEKPATDKQLHWVVKAGTEKLAHLEPELVEIVVRATGGVPILFAEAKKVLDVVFSPEMKAKTAKGAPGADLAEGMYMVNGKIHKVQLSKAGKPYAKVLFKNQDKKSGYEFCYISGAIYQIKPEHRMTVEQAAAFGVETGTCCVCNATLTDPKSIAAGIGPVCAKKV